jgi:hypothetical protein
MEDFNFIVKADGETLGSGLLDWIESTGAIGRLLDNVDFSNYSTEINDVIDIDNIASEVVDKLDMDAVTDEVYEKLDLDSLVDEVYQRMDSNFDLSDSLNSLMNEYNPPYHCGLGDNVTQLISTAIQYLLKQDDFALIMSDFVKNCFTSVAITPVGELNQETKAFMYKDVSNAIDTTVKPVQDKISLTADEIIHAMERVKYGFKLPDNIQAFIDSQKN